jgi:hypothetical protein
MVTKVHVLWDTVSSRTVNFTADSGEPGSKIFRIFRPPQYEGGYLFQTVVILPLWRQYMP